MITARTLPLTHAQLRRALDRIHARPDVREVPQAPGPVSFTGAALPSIEAYDPDPLYSADIDFEGSIDQAAELYDALARDGSPARTHRHGLSPSLHLSTVKLDLGSDAVVRVGAAAGMTPTEGEILIVSFVHAKGARDRHGRPTSEAYTEDRVRLINSILERAGLDRFAEVYNDGGLPSVRVPPPHVLSLAHGGNREAANRALESGAVAIRPDGGREFILDFSGLTFRGLGPIGANRALEVVRAGGDIAEVNLGARPALDYYDDIRDLGVVKDAVGIWRVSFHARRAISVDDFGTSGGPVSGWVLAFELDRGKGLDPAFGIVGYESGTYAITLETADPDVVGEDLLNDLVGDPTLVDHEPR